MLTVVYAFGGVGSIIGSFVYMRLSAKLGMRAVSAIGAIATAISLAAVLVPEFAAVCVGWLINNLGYGLLAHGVIVSRQLLLSGGDLAKFSGRARFAYAIGGSVGTWGRLARLRPLADTRRRGPGTVRRIHPVAQGHAWPGTALR